MIVLKEVVLKPFFVIIIIKKRSMGDQENQEKIQHLDTKTEGESVSHGTKRGFGSKLFSLNRDHLVPELIRLLNSSFWRK